MKDKTRDRANTTVSRLHNQLTFPRKNKRIVYESWYIPQPINVEIPYNIFIKTEYRIQMNSILASFMSRIGNINSFYLEKNGHRYEAFVDENFASNNNSENLENNERIFETTIKITVIGHITGEEENQRTPKIIKRENWTDIAIKEYIVDSIPE